MKNLKVFHIDAGRKYYSKEQLMDLIDVCSDHGFNLLELAIGNDGFRMLLECMDLTTPYGSYAGDCVRSALHEGNLAYCDNGTNELTEEEVDFLIRYAGERGIGVMPLINSPGHMDAILTAMIVLGISDPAYKSSATTVDLNNREAVAFTVALLEKYIQWFAGKGCSYFNLGSDEYANDVLASGFASLQNKEQYEYHKFIAYVNQLAAIIKENRMTPVMFNDGVYYNKDLTGGMIDKDIVVSYWSFGWPSYDPAPVEFVEAQGHKILDTAAAWYYVLGRTEGDGGNQDFTYQSALKSMTDPVSPIASAMKKSSPIGSMFCLWSDAPQVPYDEKEAARLHCLLEHFHPKQQPE